MSTLTADALPAASPPPVVRPEQNGVADAPPPAASSEPFSHFVVLENIPWSAYEAIVNADPGRNTPRIAYDNGVLEIMSPLLRHERKNRLIATLVEIIAEEWGLDLENTGSVTLKRSDLLKGLEPDTCFYIQSLDAIFGKDTLDLEEGDPPPDLVIEMDATHPSLVKMPIYAGLGVPEVWIATASGVSFFALQSGRYEACEESVALPPLTRTVVEDFVVQSATVRRAQWLRTVRQWARDNRPAATETSDEDTITP